MDDQLNFYLCYKLTAEVTMCPQNYIRNAIYQKTARTYSTNKLIAEVTMCL